MVRVLIEVHSGAARFRAGVQAKSIQRAVNLAEGLYSAGDVRVIFPLNSGGSFSDDVGAQGEQIEFEVPQQKTAA